MRACVPRTYRFQGPSPRDLPLDKHANFVALFVLLSTEKLRMYLAGSGCLDRDNHVLISCSIYKCHAWTSWLSGIGCRTPPTAFVARAAPRQQLFSFLRESAARSPWWGCGCPCLTFSLPVQIFRELVVANARTVWSFLADLGCQDRRRPRHA